MHASHFLRTGTTWAVQCTAIQPYQMVVVESDVSLGDVLASECERGRGRNIGFPGQSRSVRSTVSGTRREQGRGRRTQDEMSQNACFLMYFHHFPWPEGPRTPKETPKAGSRDDTGRGRTTQDELLQNACFLAYFSYFPGLGSLLAARGPKGRPSPAARMPFLASWGPNGRRGATKSSPKAPNSVPVHQNRQPAASKGSPFGDPASAPLLHFGIRLYLRRS